MRLHAASAVDALIAVRTHPSAGLRSTLRYLAHLRSADQPADASRAPVRPCQSRRFSRRRVRISANHRAARRGPMCVEIRSGPNLYIFGRYSGYHNLYNIRSKRHQGNPPDGQYCQLIRRNVLFSSKSNLRRCWALIWQPCAFNASMCPMTRLIVQRSNAMSVHACLNSLKLALPAFVPRAAIIANLFEAGGRGNSSRISAVRNIASTAQLARRTPGFWSASGRCA
jgi:hypothetical protein